MLKKFTETAGFWDPVHVKVKLSRKEATKTDRLVCIREQEVFLLKEGANIRTYPGLAAIGSPRRNGTEHPLLLEGSSVVPASHFKKYLLNE